MINASINYHQNKCQLIYNKNLLYLLICLYILFNDYVKNLRTQIKKFL